MSHFQANHSKYQIIMAKHVHIVCVCVCVCVYMHVSVKSVTSVVQA